MLYKLGTTLRHPGERRTRGEYWVQVLGTDRWVDRQGKCLGRHSFTRGLAQEGQERMAVLKRAFKVSFKVSIRYLDNVDNVHTVATATPTNPARFFPPHLGKPSA